MGFFETLSVVNIILIWGLFISGLVVIAWGIVIYIRLKAPNLNIAINLRTSYAPISIGYEKILDTRDGRHKIEFAPRMKKENMKEQYTIIVPMLRRIRFVELANVTIFFYLPQTPEEANALIIDSKLKTLIMETVIDIRKLELMIEKEKADREEIYEFIQTHPALKDRLTQDAITAVMDSIKQPQPIKPQELK